jgi:hypothetical protein
MSKNHQSNLAIDLMFGSTLYGVMYNFNVQHKLIVCHALWSFMLVLVCHARCTFEKMAVGF